LNADPALLPLLRKLDAFRGPDREEQIQGALGVARDQQSFALNTLRASLDAVPLRGYTKEEMGMLRTLAEAIEGAVRGGKDEALGLDWES
jgi:hypothetical protein